MARKTARPTAEPLSPPRLLSPREQVRQQLAEQVAKGRGLKDLDIRSKDGLDRADAEFEKWSKFNMEILTRVFDNEGMVREYQRAWGINSLAMNPSLAEMVARFRQEVSAKITVLESIIERLDLIPEVQGMRAPAEKESVVSSRQVFVVHGRDEAAKEAVSRLLERIGLHPIVLHEQPNAGRTIIEKIEDYSDAAFAIVLLTPDDVGGIAKPRGDLRPRARQNVILELGFFLGKLGRHRVCALHTGDIEIPTDFQGVLYVPMDSAGAWRFLLTRELKEAGLEVDLNRLA